MEQSPDTKVLIFTAYSERSLLNRGFESGAQGYILKESPHATLVRAIEKVAAGEAYVDPALMPQFLAGPRPRRPADGARARDPQAARRRALERRRRRQALHLAGDGEEPRPAHPHQARGRHAHARGRDRASRGDHRLSASDPMSGARARTADRRRAGRAPAPRPVPARRPGAGALRDRADGRRRAPLDRERPARRGAGDHRRPRSTGSARRSGSCATSRSRSSRSCCATTASRRRCASWPTR